MIDSAALKKPSINNRVMALSTLRLASLIVSEIVDVELRSMTQCSTEKMFFVANGDIRK
jgi:hypothetical protein